MNNIITASRMNSLMHCPRAHFWAYEVGLQKDEASHALRFGSAWHRAMEARWNGQTYEEALAFAIPEGIDLDEYSCATLAGLLAGYYDHYGHIETVGKLNPEVQFQQDLGGLWEAQGKIDGLGSLHDNRSVLIESKTTGDRIDPASDYWLRLNFNMQVYQYVHAARSLGWDISEVLYDVCRKPMIRPKEVYDLDSKGLKIVLDKDGNRVFKTKKVVVKPKKKLKKNEKGKTEYKEVPDETKPMQSANEANGWTVKKRMETPDEFSERLWKDALARPEFYFCRKEVPILDGDMEQFIKQRESLIQVIRHFRSQEQTDINLGDRDETAWPRNVSTTSCQFCIYKSFCLQNIKLDINNLPEKFIIKGFNPELEQYANTTEETNDTNPAS